MMAGDHLVDPEQLRAQVREKYREVATDPRRSFHFHTGRPLAARLGYEEAAVGALPDRAVESFAGVGNPTFGGAEGESKARAFEVFGHAFLARKPT